MADVLILYSTTDGHTARISARLQQTVEAQGHAVVVAPIDAAATLPLQSFDAIVIGASIRYGRHNKRVGEFIRRNLALLEARPNAFFSVSIVARKPNRNRPDTNPYLRRFLRQTAWRPQLLAVFAGKLDYPRYRFFDRLMIRLIMKMTRGPTDPRTVIDYTDWQQVEAFGRDIAASAAGKKR